MKIVCCKKQQADFYIQSKGLHSGRPLRNAIPNCFAVYDSKPEDFSLVQALYIGRFFEPLIRGSVIPFVSIREVRQVVNFGLENFKAKNIKKLETIDSIDKQLEVVHQQLKIYKELRTAIAQSVFK